MMEKRARKGFDAEAFAKIAVDGWMESKEHRENILSPDYDRAGIGVAVKVISPMRRRSFADRRSPRIAAARSLKRDPIRA